MARCSIRYVSFHVRTNQQKLPSSSVSVMVYDFAKQPVDGSACEQSAFGSEFEIGDETSGEDMPRRASPRAPSAGVAES